MGTQETIRQGHRRRFPTGIEAVDEIGEAVLHRAVYGGISPPSMPVPSARALEETGHRDR